MPKKFFIGCFFLLLTGCSATGPEELDRLTKEDPTFRQMITVRDQAHAEIRSIKEDLLGKKKVMDTQVDRLRADYDAYAKLQNQKMEKCEAVIDTNRTALKRELQTDEMRLDAKKSEFEGYQKTLGDVQKVLKEGKGFYSAYFLLNPAPKKDIYQAYTIF